MTRYGRTLLVVLVATATVVVLRAPSAAQSSLACSAEAQIIDQLGGMPVAIPDREFTPEEQLPFQFWEENGIASAPFVGESDTVMVLLRTGLDDAPEFASGLLAGAANDRAAVSARTPAGDSARVMTLEGPTGPVAFHMSVRSLGGVVVAATSLVSPEILEPRAVELGYLDAVIDAQMAAIDGECFRFREEPDIGREGQITGAALGTLAFWAIPEAGALWRERRRRSKIGAPPSTDAVDISAQVRARHTKARRVQFLAFLALALGVGLTTETLLTEGGRSSLVLVPATLLVVWAIMRRGGRRPPQRQRRQWYVHLLTAVAWFVAALAVASLINLVRVTQMTDTRVQIEALKDGVTEATYRNTATLAPLAFFLGAALISRLAGWLAQRPGSTIFMDDARPPVLLLRSFADDKLRVHTYSPAAGALQMFSLRRTERYEETVARSLSQIGPLVTVQNPRRRRHRLGAARVRITTEPWQDAVVELMESASWIIVAIGDSPSVLEEASLIAQHGHLEKTLFLVPPTNDATKRWPAIAGVIGHGADEVTIDQSVLAVRWVAGRPVAYRSTHFGAHAYDALIAMHLQPQPVAAPPPPPPLSPSRAT